MIHYATFVFSILMMIDLIVYNTTDIIWLGLVLASLPIVYTVIEYVINMRTNSFCIITPCALVISIVLYYTNAVDKSTVVTMSIIVVSSILEFMFYITVFSQMGDITEEFKKNAQLSIVLDSTILFVTVGYMIQYFADSNVIVIYASIVLGILCIGGGFLLYPVISNMINARTYTLTNNEEQEIELGINDEEI
jgi:hypothetical protein